MVLISCVILAVFPFDVVVVCVLCCFRGRYTEFDFILIGDNGQGDVRTAELIHADPVCREALVRSYFHEVQPVHNTYALLESTRRRSCSFLHYFVTYIDAAIDAYKSKLIRLSGLQRIAVECARDFESVQWSVSGGSSASGGGGAGHAARSLDGRPSLARQVSASKSDSRREARLIEINSSIYRANDLLARGGLCPVKLLRFPQMFRSGCLVHTPLGLGVVERFRPSDGTYVVMLQCGVSPSGRRGYVAYLRSQCLAKVVLRTFSLLPSWMPGGGTLGGGALGNPLQRSLRQGQTMAKGKASAWIVWTPYGMGKLLEDKRARDGLSAVRLCWGAVLYIQATKVHKMLECEDVPSAASAPPSSSPSFMMKVLSPAREGGGGGRHAGGALASSTAHSTPVSKDVNSKSWSAFLSTFGRKAISEDVESKTCLHQEATCSSVLGPEGGGDAGSLLLPPVTGAEEKHVQPPTHASTHASTHA